MSINSGYSLQFFLLTWSFSQFEEHCIVGLIWRLKSDKMQELTEEREREWEREREMKKEKEKKIWDWEQDGKKVKKVGKFKCGGRVKG